MKNGLPSGMKQFQLRTSVLGIIILVTLFFIPVVNGFREALLSPKLEAELLENPLFLKSLKFTFTQALLSTVISAMIGAPTGIFLALIPPRISRIIRIMFFTAFMAPSMVVVMGFTSLYGKNGLISSIFPVLGNLGEGFPAIIAAHVFYNAPLIAIMSYNSITSIPREYWDVILSSTAPLSFYTIRKIFLPYTLSGVLTGSLLTFIYCFMSFAIPLNLGGPQYSTLEVNIYMYFKILQNTEMAEAIALMQYLILLVVTIILIKPTFSASYAPLTPKAIIPLKKGYKKIVAILPFSLLIYEILPLIGSLYYSIYDPMTHSFTLTFYRNILSLEYDSRLGIAPIKVMINTVYFAGMTVLLSLAISTILSLGSKRINELLVLSLMAISPVTLGLGLLRSIPPSIPVWAGIVLAHTFAALPLSLRSIRIGIDRVSYKFIETSISYGETMIGTIFRIIIPVARHSYILAAAFAAAVSLGEFGATLFLRTMDTTTLAVAIYQYRSLRLFGEAYATSSILLIFTSCILYFISRLEKGEEFG